MTRKPNDDAAYQWWRDALSGLKPQITDQPHPGFYRRKLVKGGPFVPVRVWMEGPRDESGELLDDEVMKCEVDGREVDAADQWLWICSYPIPEREYTYMIGLSKYAKKHDKREPLANPRKPINPLTFRLPEFPQAKRKSK